MHVYIPQDQTSITTTKWDMSEGIKPCEVTVVEGQQVLGYHDVGNHDAWLAVLLKVALN